MLIALILDFDAQKRELKAPFLSVFYDLFAVEDTGRKVAITAITDNADNYRILDLFSQAQRASDRAT